MRSRATPGESTVTLDDEHFRKLERMYASAPINRYFRPALRVSEGGAEVTMTVRDDFFHAAHAVHGAVYFKALDDAAFFAASSLVTDVFMLTVSFNIQLLRPVSGGVLRAVGKVVHRSRSLILADAELTSDEGKPVARGSGSFMPGKTALSAAIGYA
ncbi:MAG: PaaI family thioesterase [Gemmatimonadales bacterium]